MPKKNGMNRFEEIRQLLKANPKMKAKDVVAALAAKGIEVTEGLVYFVRVYYELDFRR